jgi:hypothetical protein
MKGIVIYFVVFLLSLQTTAQISSNSQENIEIGTFISSNKNLPFWSRTSQYGIVPLKGNFLTLRGSISKENKIIFSRFKKVKWGYGIQGVLNVGKVNQILLPEAFLKITYGSMEFYSGRKKETIGLIDSLLTSGSYIWSGNALPIPKIQISIPNYTSIISKGLISIKGSYGHGWFNNELLRHSYLHQKTVYMRVGKPSWKIKMYSGFNHQVQGGGGINLPYKLNSVRSNQLPSSFNDYVFVVSGLSLNYQSRQKKIDTTKYSDFDLTNRVGNHLGTIDLAIEINTKKIKIFAYRQNLYDDGSLFALANIKDGLNGLSIMPILGWNRKINIERISFEFLNTGNQGGNVGPSSTIPEIRGKDNYFNHSQFLNGWSYSGNTIGTPFIPPTKYILNSFPKYQISNPPQYLEYFTNNNRVKAYYLATQINIFNKYTYIFRGSYSKNFGTYDVPFRDNNEGIIQVSLQNSFKFDLKNKTTFSVNWTADIGSLYANSNCIYFSIRKNWQP